jgi:hypothetical protein
MRIATTATPNADNDNFQTLENSFEPTVKTEAKEQEEEKEPQEDAVGHGTLDAEVKQEKERLASVKQEWKQDETGGRRIKQEQPQGLEYSPSGGDILPADTEARLQPHIFSQNTGNRYNNNTNNNNNRGM